MTDPKTRFAPGKQPVAAPSAAAVIWAGVTDALGSAFLLWVLGGVAISIAGSFAGGMIPSPPPGFAEPHPLGGHHAGHSYAWWHAVRDSAFGLFFLIFLAHSLWLGFHGAGAVAGRRLRRILTTLRAHWFTLVVGNAIGAWLATLVLSIVQNFSPARMLWHAVCSAVLPVVGELGRLVLGTSASRRLGDWFSWYGANQAKLNFWVLYLAAAFDDLGIPNFKTLVRWAWRRYKKPRAIAPAPQTAREDVMKVN